MHGSNMAESVPVGLVIEMHRGEVSNGGDPHLFVNLPRFYPSQWVEPVCGSQP